jgi:hypothetical protein
MCHRVWPGTRAVRSAPARHWPCSYSERTGTTTEGWDIVDTTARPRHRRPPSVSDGVAGNERLTALTGTVLLVGFALEGLTLLALGRLLTLHMFLGMMLIGPVLLKICSTGYRFVRYYTGSEGYADKGPPAPILRLLGPVVILTSLAVLGTGVALALAGRGTGPWLFLHKASFVLWFGAMTVHVLTYVWRLPRILLGTDGGGARPARGGIRWLLIGASLAGGLVLALLAMRLATGWDAWTAR